MKLNPLVETKWECQRWSFLHCHWLILLRDFYLQVIISESDEKTFFFPPALLISLSASSKKRLAFCKLGWICTLNLPICSYLLSDRWVRRREGEQNYKFTYSRVELASG